MSTGSGPKIVVFDLETLPNLEEALRSWTQLSQFPGKTMRATITSIICAGWKILGDKETYCINAWDFPNWEFDVNDDSMVCMALYDVLHDADAVITHNGRRFDWKYLQTRLLKNGLPLLDSKIPHVDTCLISSKNLFSLNNKLGYLGEWMVGDSKLENGGWDLWVDTWHKDKKAMKLMEEYCIQDVVLLEKVFEKLKPFAHILPNHNQFRRLQKVIDGEYVCPNCGSIDLRNNGWRRTKTRMYKRMMCLHCGTWSRLDAKDQLPRTY